MDNNKKQQQSHYARATKSCASTENNRKSSDLYANNKARSSRRREQLATPRNEQQQHQQQQQQRDTKQQQSAKLRPNVDKRPRTRGGAYGQGGGGGNDDAACTGDDNAHGSTGLAASSSSYPRGGFDFELKSVYAHGSKKQNWNHLLNFHCVPRETDHGMKAAYANHVRKPRYNKEQFLQANFQFVIRSSAKAQVNGSPDALIDWNLIEQINIQTTEEPQCPICLYPPVAAKLTRCGHAYCWPCLLHYLSLSDKTWRKCPICYDAIHAADLKSCTIVQQHALKVGDQITFQLMRRRKGSMYIERFNAAGLTLEAHERFPLLSVANEAKRYSKFLIAKRADIACIIERERRELLAETDESCPEYVFIQQALLSLNERCEKLGLAMSSELEEREELEEQQVPLETATSTTREAGNEAKGFEVEKEDNASVSSEEIVAAAGTNNNNKYYYFYQSNDGQNIYLHPLNVKMLQACYGSLEMAPLIIDSHILQKEQHSMDEDHRRKFTCLGHLPLTCQFAVVEVELQPPIVSSGILKLFKDDLLHREKERQRREREERKREQHINELNDRQMGKLIASAVNLNLSSAHEFPTCGFEEALPAPSQSMTIPHEAGARYASVAVSASSPKLELWPTIGSSSSPTTSLGARGSPNELKFGAWGRAAPPPAAAAPIAVANRSTDDADNEMRAVGPWALGELLEGALHQQKTQQQRASKPDESNKKQKKSKSKKMVPLFAVGMNRAP